MHADTRVDAMNRSGVARAAVGGGREGGGDLWLLRGGLRGAPLPVRGSRLQAARARDERGRDVRPVCTGRAGDASGLYRGKERGGEPAAAGAAGETVVEG
jgi:hypothetical protein